MSKLAITGGTPVRSTLFPSQNTIGPAEKEAAQRVLDSGILTGYQGNWGPNFWGGPEVRALEEEWAAKFGVKHTIACNSATSGLFIACGAAGMGYSVDKDNLGQRGGDAIVGPFSMTCSATAPLGWGEGVHFADIERDFYCIDPKSVGQQLDRMFTKKYSAVIPVSIFGQPYDAQGLKKLLDDYQKKIGRRIYVIEDAAQAVGATLEWEEDSPSWNGGSPTNPPSKKERFKKYAGTLGDIGVYSFNLGKHLTCGEGGMIVTDDDELAMRCRLIMNHAEAVVNDMAGKAATHADGLNFNKYKSLFGFNLRLPEISAAIVRVQLAKMDVMVGRRQDNVAYLVDRLKDIPCLEMPKLRPGATHSYYVLPLKFKTSYWAQLDHGDGIGHPTEVPITFHRDKFVAAVKAELQPVKDRESEGVTIGCGYIKPIQSMPLFGRSADETPECTRQWADELIIVHRMFGPNASRRDLDDVVNAFTKVWENREELL